MAVSFFTATARLSLLVKACQILMMRDCEASDCASGGVFTPVVCPAGAAFVVCSGRYCSNETVFRERNFRGNGPFVIVLYVAARPSKYENDTAGIETAFVL
jgi:hypothetical protein